MLDDLATGSQRDEHNTNQDRTLRSRHADNATDIVCARIGDANSMSKTTEYEQCAASVKPCLFGSAKFSHAKQQQGEGRVFCEVRMHANATFQSGILRGAETYMTASPCKNDANAQQEKEKPQNRRVGRDDCQHESCPANICSLQSIRSAPAIGSSVADAVDLGGYDAMFMHLDLVFAGWGVGVVHIDVASQIESLAPVVPELAIPPLEMWLTAHADLRTSLRIRRVYDFLAEAVHKQYASGLSD